MTGSPSSHDLLMPYRWIDCCMTRARKSSLEPSFISDVDLHNKFIRYFVDVLVFDKDAVQSFGVRNIKLLRLRLAMSYYHVQRNKTHSEHSTNFCHATVVVCNQLMQLPTFQTKKLGEMACLR